MKTDYKMWPNYLWYGRMCLNQNALLRIYYSHVLYRYVKPPTIMHTTLVGKGANVTGVACMHTSCWYSHIGREIPPPRIRALLSIFENVFLDCTLP